MTNTTQNGHLPVCKQIVNDRELKMKTFTTIALTLCLNYHLALAGNIEDYRNTTWSYTEDGETISIQFHKTGASLVLGTGDKLEYDAISLIDATEKTPALILLESSYYGSLEFAIDEKNNCLRFYGEDAPDVCLVKEAEVTEEATAPYLNSLKELKTLVEYLNEHDIEDFDCPGIISSIKKQKESQYKVSAGSRVLTLEVASDSKDSNKLSINIVKATGKKSKSKLLYNRSLEELTKLVKFLKTKEVQEAISAQGAIESITKAERDYEIAAGNLRLTAIKKVEPLPEGFTGKSEFKFILGTVKTLEE